MHCRAQSWKKVIKIAGLVSKATSIMGKEIRCMSWSRPMVTAIEMWKLATKWYAWAPGDVSSNQTCCQ